MALWVVQFSTTTHKTHGHHEKINTFMYQKLKMLHFTFHKMGWSMGLGQMTCQALWKKNPSVSGPWSQKCGILVLHFSSDTEVAWKPWVRSKIIRWWWLPRTAPSTMRWRREFCKELAVFKSQNRSAPSANSANDSRQCRRWQELQWTVPSMARITVNGAINWSFLTSLQVCTTGIYYLTTGGPIVQIFKIAWLHIRYLVL